MTPEERATRLWQKLHADLLQDAVGQYTAVWDATVEAIAQARAEALEEAARVADDKRPDDGDPINLGYNIACEDIAAAIRALKDGEPKP